MKKILILLILLFSINGYCKPVVDYAESYSVTSVEAVNNYGIFGGFDGSIRIVNVITSEINILPRIHNKQIVSMSVSRDGRYLLSSSQDDIVVLWDLTKMEAVKKIVKTGMGIRAVLINHEGSKIYIAFPTTIYEYNISSWENTGIFEGYKNGIYSMAVNYNDSILSAGSKTGDIYITDIKKKEIIKTLKSGNQLIISLDFASKNNKLISGGYDKTVRIFDIDNYKLLKEFSFFNDTVRAVKLNNDSSRCVISSDDGKVMIYDIKSGLSVDRSYGESGEVTAMSAVDDFSFIVYGRGLPYEEERYGITAFGNKNGVYRKIYMLPLGDIIVSENGYLSIRGNTGEYISSYYGGNKESMQDIIRKYMIKDKLKIQLP